MQNKFGKISLIIFGIISPIIPILMYFWGNFYDLLNPYSISMFFGIMSYIYFLNVLIISARIKVLDRIFGHDRVMIFHGNMAMAAIILAVLHRFFKLKVYSQLNLQMKIGEAALIIFFFIMVITIFFMVQGILQRFAVIRKIKQYVNNTLKLDYSIFKLLHNFMIAAIIFMAIHVYLASSTQENWNRVIGMGIWAVIAISLWCWHKLIKPILQKRKGFTVKEVKHLNEDITEISFSKDSVKKYKAGQFIFIRFPKLKLGWDEHPFTLSSDPKERTCKITIKNLGDFSAKVRNLAKGDKLSVDGPYGTFTVDNSDKPLILIAGGIGITPFYSIIKDLSTNTDRSIILLWAVKYEKDLVYRKELKEIESKTKNFTFIPVISRISNSEEYETGHIDKEIITKYLKKDPKEYNWYFCGPENMKKAIFKNISELGVKSNKIKHEKFSF